MRFLNSKGKKKLLQQKLIFENKARTDEEAKNRQTNPARAERSDSATICSADDDLERSIVSPFVQLFEFLPPKCVTPQKTKTFTQLCDSTFFFSLFLKLF